MEILGRCILAMLIHLAFVACLNMSNAVTLHHQPVITSSHDLPSQERSIGVGSHQSCVHLLDQMIGFLCIYTSQEGGIMSPFVQDLSAQEELEGHSPDVLLLILDRLRWVLFALYKALDIVIPRSVVYLCFNIHAFFHAHTVCWNVLSFDLQWSHIVPLSQLDQAS